MKLFITYQYFTPAYKAGGPVQSLDNLVRNYAGKGHKLYVFTSNNEIDDTALTSVKHDVWVEFAQDVMVYYSSGRAKKINEILNEVKPDIIFINGIYSYKYTITPLLWKGAGRKIVSVRGMLHPGALSQKALKKRFFLTLYKILGLNRKCEYHATTDDEAGYIRDVFGSKVKVWVAPNFPKIFSVGSGIQKVAGELSLVTVALISPMKNIKLVLEALLKCKSRIEYHIYGPIKDNAYWIECRQLIERMPGNVKIEYHGAIDPASVEEVLVKHHAFIMPSKSENFGHAIFEALTAGLPVITSHYTPWNALAEYNAGYNVTTEKPDEVTKAIDKLANLDQEDYKKISSGAAAYARTKINVNSIQEAYDVMFGIAS